MRLPKEKIHQLVYETMEEINEKLGTDFSKEKLEIEFFTPSEGILAYEKICRNFPKYLEEKYQEEGYFETFAAMAFLGEDKDGILIREGIDADERDWHHIILHEFSHIIVGHDELDGENFFDKYCRGYAADITEDGWINAGYAIWREFSAEMFALDLDDSVYPYSINDEKNRIKKLLSRIRVGDVCAKESLQKILNILFKSDEYYYSKNEDEFIEKIKRSKASAVLLFEPVIRMVFAHLLQERAWKINIEFITSLGYQYILCLANREVKEMFS